jgi:hypothetical protein
MSQEIVTGNLLSDGIIYHASDINAAINLATIGTGLIANRALQTPASSDRLLTLTSVGQFASTTLQSLSTLSLTNGVTSGPLNVKEGIQLSGLIAVAVSGTLNDYNPTGLDKATMVGVTGTATITGMQAAPTGTIKIIFNFSGAGTVTISRENAASAALNRFSWGSAGGDIPLILGQAIVCIYTAGVSARWLVLCSNKSMAI